MDIREFLDCEHCAEGSPVLLLAAIAGREVTPSDLCEHWVACRRAYGKAVERIAALQNDPSVDDGR